LFKAMAERARDRLSNDPAARGTRAQAGKQASS
jgi:hypothetical protein